MRKKRIVLIESDEALSDVLVDGLRRAGFDVFLGLAHAQQADLIVLGSWEKQAGLTLLQSLKDDLRTRRIPVIILAFSGSDADVKKFLELGAADYIVKEQHAAEEILERIKNFTTFRERGEAPSGVFDYVRLKLDALKKHLGFMGKKRDEGTHVLFVDNDESARRIYGGWMADAGFNILYARDGNEAREIARRLHPDIILLDVVLPKHKVLGDAFDLASILKNEAETTDIPIVFFTSSDFSPEAEKLAQSTGITDYIHKGVDREEFIKKIKSITK